MARPTRFDVRDHRTWDAYMHGDHPYPDEIPKAPRPWIIVPVLVGIIIIAVLLSLWLL